MGTVGRPAMTSFRHDELRRRRIHAGLTQTAAAELLGVSHWTYRQWEGGKHAPLAERLPQIAAVLDCDTHDLVATAKREDDLRHGGRTANHPSGGRPRNSFSFRLAAAPGQQTNHRDSHPPEYQSTTQISPLRYSHSGASTGTG